MFLSMLVAVAVSTPQDWGALVTPRISGKAVLQALRQQMPPPGQPPVPLTLRLTVVPPAPAAPYVVILNYDSINFGAWVGSIPAGAMAPFPGGKYVVFPYMEVVRSGQYVTRIRCNPPGLSTSDYGGGDIAHNPGPVFSAGPGHAYNFLGQGSVTVGYAFAVGP